MALLARIILHEMTKDQLQKLVVKQSKNIARRSERIQALGMKTRDMDQFQQVQSKLEALKDKRGSLEGAKRGELLKVASQLNKLDMAPGNRVSTAARAYYKEQQADRRNELIEALDNPYSANRLSADELREAVSLKRKRLRDQVRSTERSVGETHATRKFKEATKDFGKLSNKNRNQLLSHGTRLSKIGEYEGMTPGGARTQMERGAKWFGDKWSTYTPEEQSAVWDEVKKFQAMEQVRSDVAVYEFRQIMDAMGGHGIARPKFDRDPSTGKIRGVDFGFDLSKDAPERAKTARRMALNAMMDRAPTPLLTV